jgi:hypothetical protein
MITEEMISELEKELNAAKKAASEAQQRLNNALNEMAQQYCPHKVGDVIDCGGWSHKGKKMIVDYIGKPKYWSRFSREKWRVTGRVFKKDGTIGQLICEFEG